ncbi:MAG: 2-oxo acid dehydrogenase subunit E2 [Chlamydiales bacterium]|nr:2-oxo acid dehydrogenase subunit E2 [Chlamydiia bacterium]MCP5508670.1 2-oxo acid dehydrogenase subunit E2 [Chlamydiales bacterium]
MKPSNTENTEIFSVTLPDIGEGVVEGEVIEWLKNEGDSIAQDEAVVVIMTDKATVELPAPYPGTLHKQHYPAGDIAHVGKPLYEIQLAAGIVANKEKTKQIARREPSETKKQVTVPLCEKALATPATRHLAKELGVDINAIHGSGKDGRIVVADLVKKAPSTPFPAFPDDENIPLVGIPKLMALKMTESAQTIPHFTFFESVDAGRLIKMRQRLRDAAETKGLHLTYMPFIIRALSLTIRQFPMINSNVDMENNKIRIHRQHNIGIAINSDVGLIVPVLHGVQAMSLEEITEKYEDLKTRALSHKLKNEEMKGATITISNFGVLGGEGRWATPIINSPEVAILAIARIFKEPFVKNGDVAIRDTMNLSWSFDHRIIDGNQAASCSQHFAGLIQNPAPLL